MAKKTKETGEELPRLQVTDQCYRAIKMLIGLKGYNQREYVSEVILASIPKDILALVDAEIAQEAVQETAPIPAPAPQGTAPEPKAQSVALPEVPSQKDVAVVASEASSKAQAPEMERTRGLPQDLVAIAKIIEMWEGGERKQVKIAKAIGYAQHTTNKQIREMKKRGELQR